MTMTLSAPMVGIHPARVSRIHKVAAEVLELELELADPDALPAYSAGAHIDVHLPNGVVRQYSLVSSCDENTYRIAVALSKTSRGDRPIYMGNCRLGRPCM